MLEIAWHHAHVIILTVMTAKQTKIPEATLTATIGRNLMQLQDRNRIVCARYPFSIAIYHSIYFLFSDTSFLEISSIKIYNMSGIQ